MRRFLWRRFSYEPRDLFWLAVLVGVFLACAYHVVLSDFPSVFAPPVVSSVRIDILTATSTSTSTSVRWAPFPNHVHRHVNVNYDTEIVSVGGGGGWTAPPVHHSDAPPWWLYPLGGAVGGAVGTVFIRRRRLPRIPAGCLLCGASTHGTSEHQESIREVDHMLERIQ